MGLHRNKKGLDLPISGTPEQTVTEPPVITRVALIGDDYPGLRARLKVEEGDDVSRGQVLFEDRANPGVCHTAPGAGRVVAINRGRRRSLQSVVIQLSTAERGNDPDAVEYATFESFRGADPESLDADAIRTLLLESGLWTAIRARPFAKVPRADSSPSAIFVNGMDSQPLAAEPAIAIHGQTPDLQLGLRLVARLCEDGPTYLCVGENSDLPDQVDAPVTVERFAGPHPAGTPGLHIHTLAPAGRNHTAWYLNLQEVVAIGKLFRSGRLPVERVISLAGPPVIRPRLVRTRLGASLEEHAAGELEQGDIRVISGSVLAGKKANGPVFGFLGRYHLQLSALQEGGERIFMGWALPGANLFSMLPIFISRLLPPKKFDFDTDTHGAPRAIVPIGMYERVMPMDIVPSYLLRALVVGDVEQAEKLGCLELDEEDISLCTFVCPGKIEYGPLLRRNLDMIEKEW